MFRKKLPRTAIPRLYKIDQEIASGKFPNAPYMAKVHETSISSIHRDIAYMKDLLKAPIEYDFFKKGYYYTEKTFRLPAAYASADDLIALGMAKNLMDLYRNTPLHDAALNLLQNISVPLKEIENTEWFKDRIIVPKSSIVPVDNEVWHKIISALKENRIITFMYDGPGVNNKKLRRVHPYQILFDQQAWFLSAYDEERKERRMFAFSCISKPELTDEKFSLKPGFDYRTFEGLSYLGVFAGSKTFKFVIEVYGDTRFVRERLFADDQVIQDLNNGIKLTFTSNQFDRVLSWLLSHGSGACPLAPKQLVDSWKRAIAEMASMAQANIKPED